MPCYFGKASLTTVRLPCMADTDTMPVTWYVVRYHDETLDRVTPICSYPDAISANLGLRHVARIVGSRVRLGVLDSRAILS